ncbi:MAG: hypothetical protein OXG96_07345 [Acidobacteria bacterium]|nr:hypothetical protein [Acidobacteriota bacterium]
MYNVVQAAAVSLRGKPWDKAPNADKMEKFIRFAARKRPDLVVLPEGLLEGSLGGINWMWVAGLATAVNLVVGYAASYLFPPPPAEVLDRVHR